MRNGSGKLWSWSKSWVRPWSVALWWRQWLRRQQRRERRTVWSVDYNTYMHTGIRTYNNNNNNNNNNVSNSFLLAHNTTENTSLTGSFNFPMLHYLLRQEYIIIKVTIFVKKSAITQSLKNCAILTQQTPDLISSNVVAGRHQQSRSEHRSAGAKFRSAFTAAVFAMSTT